MTVKEFYESISGSYDEVKSRLMTDRLVEKFMLKFPQDDTMEKLNAAIAAEDYEAAFMCAHTLKGVAANLGFSQLQSSASALTEFLRADKIAPEAGMVQKVRDDYESVMEALRMYQNV